MRVVERAVYRGPHLYSQVPMVRFMLDLEELETLPTSQLPGFPEALERTLPGLRNHRCSRRHAGGFSERMREGTWLGHVIEHVALELQTLAGTPVSRGKTRSVPGTPGIYSVLVSYRSPDIALLASRIAIQHVASLLPRNLSRVVGLDVLAGMPATDPGEEIAGFRALQQMVARNRLGPTTQSLVDAAEARGIEWSSVDEGRFIRLGTGSRQKLIRASITSQTSHIAVELAGNKAQAKALLDRAGIPVPRGVVVTEADTAVEAAQELHLPVVTKPLDGNHGRGITLGLTTPGEVRNGFETAAQHGARVIVEEQLVGRDYRILVVDGKFVAASERRPAHVIGDGTSTITALIERLNLDPRRGPGHSSVLTRITVDDDLVKVLASSGLNVASIPAEGQHVALRHTANLSAGGDAVDRTDQVHPANIAIAERAARVIGLDVAGLDIITPDIALDMSTSGGGIVEINAAPGFRMHLNPSEGQPRDVATPVIESLFPGRTSSRIPITAVTGTNGKSTTVRMIAHILAHTGTTVGMTTTSGIYIGDQLIRAVDASGPKSARTILGDASVDTAVLETARGGILREGLAYSRADVGVVMNITADHLGLKGVNTLDDLARVKGVVARNVRHRGTTVLNADDPRTRGMARYAGGRVAYFTTRGGDLDEELASHVRSGGLLARLEATPQRKTLWLHDRGDETLLMDAAEIPATIGGTALFNIQNALAAALAAYAQHVPIDTIRVALRTFESSFEQNPGRMNITTAPGFTAILDYAHNPAAMQALGVVISHLRPTHDRVIGVVSVPGDRRDDDIRELGRIAATIFDDLVFRERPDGRGRAAGGVITLLCEGAEQAGMPPERIRRVMDEHAAVQTALELANPADLVVVSPTEVAASWQQIESFRGASGENYVDSVPRPSQRTDA